MTVELEGFENTVNESSVFSVPEECEVLTNNTDKLVLLEDIKSYTFLQQACAELFTIIDNVDTISDAVKDNNVAYRSQVENQIKKFHYTSKIVSDGFKLFGKFNDFIYIKVLEVTKVENNNLLIEDSINLNIPDSLNNLVIVTTFFKKLLKVLLTNYNIKVGDYLKYSIYNDEIIKFVDLVKKEDYLKEFPGE